jgi:hypothetical protein
MASTSEDATKAQKRKKKERKQDQVTKVKEINKKNCIAPYRGLEPRAFPTPNNTNKVLFGI